MKAQLAVRMFTPLAIISLLLLALGGASAWYVHRLQKQVSQVMAQNVASVRTAEELEIGIHKVIVHLKDYLIQGNRQHLRKVEELQPELDAAIAQAAQLSTTPREQELMTRVRQGHDRFIAEFERLAKRDTTAGMPVVEVAELVDNTLSKEILEPTHEYLELNEAIAASTSEQNQRMASRLVLANLLLGTCGAVAGLVAGYGIARGISRSMVQLNIPIRDATGKLSEVVGPITFAGGGDFPELKASLQQLTGQISLVVERLQHSQRDVLRAEQLAAVGQMAAGLAHELRNPLMSMKVLVQPGDDGAAVHLTGRDLAVLNEEITRLDRSIQSFLDFARPPQLEKRSFDLRPVLEQTLQLVRGRAENQGVTLHWQPPDEPVPIEADMGQVRQVVLNLLLNALDSTPQGGQVELHLERQPGPNGEWLWLQVADTGPGLPDGLGLRIFEPFVSTKETGMGLGLSICKRIVEAHGGEISAANRTEGGASFAVGLPLRPKNEDRATRNGD